MATLDIGATAHFVYGEEDDTFEQLARAVKGFLEAGYLHIDVRLTTTEETDTYVQPYVHAQILYDKWA